MVLSSMFLALLLTISCCFPAQGQIPELSYSTERYNKVIQGLGENCVLELKESIDLDGKTLILPDNVTIKGKGGLIRNGRIVGKNTAIISKGTVFDKVTIDGTWIVKNISTLLFNDLNYCNSLKDVFALSNCKITNNIYVEPGEYYVKAKRQSDACLRVGDNTTIVLDGNITLQPNDFISYNIIRIEGTNVYISGSGGIKGDRSSHLGKKGEWGMGIGVYKSNNAQIRGLSIQDCWGDCIYIAGHSKKVKIDNCNLSNSRRQGISITSASNVKICNCKISDINGTEPQYGIDIEPNMGDTVSHVSIHNTSIHNCKGGIMTFGRAQNAFVTNVLISRCTFSNMDTDPIHLNKSEKIRVEKCEIYSSKSRTINCYQTNHVALIKNSIRVKSILQSGNATYDDFIIKKSSVTCKNNKIIYY